MDRTGLEREKEGRIKRWIEKRIKGSRQGGIEGRVERGREQLWNPSISAKLKPKIFRE
jgi:hypothetical protein